MFRPILVIPLLLLVTHSWMAGLPSRSAGPQDEISSPLDNTVPYLELSITPPVAIPGSLVTLHITYHNIGEQWTDIVIDPSASVAYDPELSMPCKYNEHPNGCTSITFRALVKGAVTFHASAYGEIFDPGCNCFYWSSASDISPAILYIVDQAWALFLPGIQR